MISPCPDSEAKEKDPGSTFGPEPACVGNGRGLRCLLGARAPLQAQPPVQPDEHVTSVRPTSPCWTAQQLTPDPGNVNRGSAVTCTQTAFARRRSAIL